jgi:undecaprenyl diphosphate synthase
MSSVNPSELPQHVAIIMDGNGRWAKKQGLLTRIRGHESGVEALRRTATAAAEIGIKYLTVYAFSSENWARPKMEVDALMGILVSALHKELPTLQDNRIKLHAIGRLHDLPASCQRQLQEVMDATAANDRMTLTLALSYGSREELVDAFRQVAAEAAAGRLEPNAIDGQAVERFLYTAGMPDPDLVIRTSGEQRISNFLLWQISYAELFFTPVLWPDFDRPHLEEALAAYAGRERRKGLTSEQVTRKPSVA